MLDITLKEKKQAKRVRESDFLEISEMDRDWVLDEIEKGRADVRDGKVSPLPKTFDGFLSEVGLENLQDRAYR